MSLVKEGITYTRDYFKNNIDSTLICLEIGPYHSPILDHNNINNYSIDICTKEEMINNAYNDHNPQNIKNIEDIPETNYLLSDANNFDLTKCVDRKFDVIISSHNFEHLPNLIKEFNNYENILKENGRVIAFIPDGNFVFDHLRNKTTLSDILDDFYMDRVKPSFKNVLDNKLHHESTTSTIQLWDRYLNLYNNNKEKYDNKYIDIESQIGKSEINTKEDVDNLFEICKSKYIDTHNYVFTSKSFEIYITWLNLYKFINLDIEIIQHTKKNDHEFCVILKK